jgi:hypothetical protein
MLLVVRGCHWQVTDLQSAVTCRLATRTSFRYNEASNSNDRVSGNSFSFFGFDQCLIAGPVRGSPKLYQRSDQSQTHPWKVNRVLTHVA